MRTFMIALTMGLGLAGIAQAQDELSLPTYAERGLQWEQPPSVREMARQFRVATRSQAGDRGVAEVACTPDERGRLDCEVVNEDPVERGYGRAAIAVMERARVSSVDGGSPAGRTFAFRLRFGDWPSRYLPDRFHPVEAGLRWTRRPALAPSAAVGLRRGERWTQTFSCLAGEGGRIACDPTGELTDRGFIQDSLLALHHARVETLSGEPSQGVRFDWTMTMERQTNCGGGRGNRNNRGQSEGVNRSFALDGSDSDSDGAPSGDRTSRCTAAIVQVGDH